MVTGCIIEDLSFLTEALINRAVIPNIFSKFQDFNSTLSIIAFSVKVSGIILVDKKVIFLALTSPSGRSKPLFRKSLESGISSLSPYRKAGPEIQTLPTSATVEEFRVGTSAGFLTPGT